MPKAVPTVPAFLAELSHEHLDAILLIRELILGTDPAISEEIKWNAPSFYTTEHFATFHLRAKNGVQVVLHRGAKVRAAVDARSTISDPTGLLEWREADRATLTFRGRSDVEEKRGAFTEIIRQWLQLV